VNAPSNDLLSRVTGFALQTGGATLKGLYEARSLIEPPAARLAAEYRSREAAAALRAQLILERATEDDPSARAKAVADFHRVLLEECGNVTLAVIGLALHDVVERHFQLSYRVNRPDSKQPLRRARAGFRSHEQLIELIEGGDGPGAEAHWIQHMKATGAFWLKKVAAKTVVDVLE
jgi:DNA-binding FadR family transcriptional regulator